jgi:hypothetical protein
MDDFNLEKLAQQIVIERFEKVSDVAEGAGAVARKIVTQAVTGTVARQSPRISVTAVCRGLMSGMLIAGRDLSPAAVAILKEMGHVANETHQDPAEMMTWAMEGIAPVATMAGEPVRAAVEAAIEHEFMGAGQVFATACATAGA